MKENDEDIGSGEDNLFNDVHPHYELIIEDIFKKYKFVESDSEDSDEPLYLSDNTHQKIIIGSSSVKLIE